MNIILLSIEDYIGDDLVYIKGKRFYHMTNVLKLEKGQKVRIGERNGMMGYGVVASIEQDGIALTIDFTDRPPMPLDVNLIVALPRPPMIRRILYTATTMGVKSINFIHSKRVEKSYWQSSSLNPREIQMQLQLGIEQAVDTVFPEVCLFKRFKPFVEDELTDISEGTQKVIAHRGGDPSEKSIAGPATIVIGPEGGFIDYEIEMLKSKGFEPYSLGERILRVESAVTAMLARVF